MQTRAFKKNIHTLTNMSVFFMYFVISSQLYIYPVNLISDQIIFDLFDNYFGQCPVCTKFACVHVTGDCATVDMHII